MILARVFTNVDPKHPSWGTNFKAYFTVAPEVGQTFFWNDWRMKIIDVGWEEAEKDEMTRMDEKYFQMVVEFNK